MYVIMKKSRLYLGGVGYAGPTCQKANVQPGRVYTDEEFSTACIDAAKLSDQNPVGFEVVEYKEQTDERLPR